MTACSTPSRCGLARAEHAARGGATANLDGVCARRPRTAKLDGTEAPCWGSAPLDKRRQPWAAVLPTTLCSVTIVDEAIRVPILIVAPQARLIPSSTGLHWPTTSWPATGSGAQPPTDAQSTASRARSREHSLAMHSYAHLPARGPRQHSFTGSQDDGDTLCLLQCEAILL